MSHARSDGERAGPRRSWRPVAHAAVGCAALLSACLSAQAATSPWASGRFVQARLISAVAGTGSLGSIPLGLELKLDDGWKTYWRAPGDAGLPPTLAWDGSANLGAANLSYPRPERLTLLNLQTFGYKHDVVFPIDVVLARAGQPLDLKLKLDLLVCAELCVPRRFDLALALPAGPALADPEAQVIARARAAVPADSTTAGMSVTAVEEVSDGGAPALEVRATARDPFQNPDVIAETDPAASFGAPRTTLSADRHSATFVIPLSETLPVGAKLAARPATLTLMDGDRALEQKAQITQGASATAEAAGPSFLAILGLALLGGLILNLMPCVLPVLSIKILSVVSQGGRTPGAVRAGFVATAAGVIVSFLAIAGVLIGLKAAGHTIGWGIQFQQPGFIAAMAALVTLFAGHLWGLFEVPLPRVVAAVANRRTGPDESLAAHFVTGAFATLLATPCSAPFLGTAVGFALAGDAAQLLAIFLALGVGLALPYLIIAAVPGLATHLPRPGRWMVLVKKAMAAPLVATAAWLVAILATQISGGLAALVAALLVGVLGLLAVRSRVPAGRSRGVVAAVVLLSGAAVLIPSLVGSDGAGATNQADDAIAWQTFDRGAIKSLVAQGKIVFVDVTADWCLTCQANRRLVLADAAMAKRLNTQTVAMQADWTRPNPSIAAFLAEYSRYGIPFNIVYGPGAPAGIPLPELLSTANVGTALDRAADRGEIHRAGATPPRTSDVD